MVEVVYTQFSGELYPSSLTRLSRVSHPALQEPFFGPSWRERRKERREERRREEGRREEGRREEGRREERRREERRREEGEGRRGEGRRVEATTDGKT